MDNYFAVQFVDGLVTWLLKLMTWAGTSVMACDCPFHTMQATQGQTDLAAHTKITGSGNDQKWNTWCCKCKYSSKFIGQRGGGALRKEEVMAYGADVTVR